MSIEAISQLISEHHLSDSFHKKNETKSPESCQTTDKVHRLVCQKGLIAKQQCDCPQAPIKTCRSSIAPSNADGEGPSVEKEKVQVIIDETAFQETYSWRATRQEHPNKKIKFRDVPDSESILYNHDIPQFDKSWNRFIVKTVNYAAQSYEDTEPFHSDGNNNIHLKIYRDHAQILLDRFLKNHPAFKGSKNRSIHQALMLQALATTIKVDEDYEIYNSDFAKCLTGNQSASLTRDLNQMERLFLKGIEWNISRSS